MVGSGFEWLEKKLKIKILEYLKVSLPMFQSNDRTHNRQPLIKSDNTTHTRYSIMLIKLGCPVIKAYKVLRFANLKLDSPTFDDKLGLRRNVADLKPCCWRKCLMFCSVPVTVFPLNVTHQFGAKTCVFISAACC